jgi:hypothetical protein
MKTLKIAAILFFATLALPGCKKDSKNSPSSDSEYYVKGTLGGKALDWQATTLSKGWVVGSIGELINDQGTIYGGIGALVSYSSGYQPQLEIEFKTIVKHIDDDATTVFNNFVDTGTWAFSNTTDFTIGTKSVVVSYTDANGNTYSSIGSQSSATFKVISISKVTGDNYNTNPGLKIKLAFSCTLYPTSGSGDPIQIDVTDGVVFLDGTQLA